MPKSKNNKKQDRNEASILAEKLSKPMKKKLCWNHFQKHGNFKAYNYGLY
jgi:hypothetical protein